MNGLHSGLLAWAARLEKQRGLLALAKLANVGLAMIWGFVVTFVFVRLLPFAEFRAFLLLVAFANFTVSAELGFSTVIYSRLRKARIVKDAGFRSEELGVLLIFMLGIVALGALLIAGAMGFGAIQTERPVLFMAFYAASALNLVALLARRALAALDHNLWWEGIDFLRRLACVLLLFAALFGLPILLVVLLQLVLTVLAILWGLVTVGRELAMPGAHWWSARTGWAQIRQNYLGDIGRTGLLTLCDITAYNAPYFTIIAVTADPRPLLLFDFIYKMSRALTAIVRALIETALPALTRYFHSGEARGFTGKMRQSLCLSLAMATGLSLALLVAGPYLSGLIYDGRLILGCGEIALVVATLAGLTLICVSVYVHNGLGQFGALLPSSISFVVGSLLSVPLAAFLAQATGWAITPCFGGAYAFVHFMMATLHARLLARLGGMFRS